MGFFVYFSPNESYFGLFLYWQFETIEPIVLPCMSLCVYLTTATCVSHKQVNVYSTNISRHIYRHLSEILWPEQYPQMHTCCTYTSFTRHEWSLHILLQWGSLSHLPGSGVLFFILRLWRDVTLLLFEVAVFLFSGIPLFYSIFVLSGLVLSSSEHWTR